MTFTVVKLVAALTLGLFAAPLAEYEARWLGVSWAAKAGAALAGVVLIAGACFAFSAATRKKGRV